MIYKKDQENFRAFLELKQCVEDQDFKFVRPLPFLKQNDPQKEEVVDKTESILVWLNPERTSVNPLFNESGEYLGYLNVTDVFPGELKEHFRQIADLDLDSLLFDIFKSTKVALANNQFKPDFDKKLTALLRALNSSDIDFVKPARDNPEFVHGLVHHRKINA